MSFQPIIPSGGLTGWAFLARTRENQTETFNKSPVLVRDTQYFEENIGSIETAEDLVADRRLLRVALGAFGLGDDIQNKFFIQTILQDGTLDTKALANRLTDKRYVEFSAAFGFGDFDTPSTKISTFGSKITTLYKEHQFEKAVGDQDDGLRLALSVKRELTEIATGSGSNATKWFSVMGSAPMRKVFETALGLPSTFGQLDLDRQLEVFETKTNQIFNGPEVNQFAETEAQDALVQRFLLMSQISEFQSYSSGQIALTLLQS